MVILGLEMVILRSNRDKNCTFGSKMGIFVSNHAKNDDFGGGMVILGQNWTFLCQKW